MSKLNKLVIGVVAIAAAGYIISKAGRHKREKRELMLSAASNEGYETAHDVLFPQKIKRARHLRYGPVLPN